MNELENFEVEFQLPEHLREKTKLVVRPLIDLMMETIKTLYPDGEYPENAMGEVVAILLPQISKAIEQYINGNMENWDI